MSDAPSSRVFTLTFAVSTLLATLFVAMQAWYARVAFVEGSQTRLLEDKLDICFDNFDHAAALDFSLRQIVPSMLLDETWPPKIVVSTPEMLRKMQYDVVPRLNDLQTGLIKASILGDLDKHRGYLVQELNGLSKRLLDLVPPRMGDEKMDREIDAVTATLSEFLGAQYSVLTGCRLVAEGKA